MRLASLATQLERTATELYEAKRLGQASNQLETRRGQLDRVLDEWKPLLVIFRRFREEGISQATKLNYARVCQKALESYLHDLRTAEIGQDPGTLRLFLDDYRQPFATELRGALANAWRAHVLRQRDEAIGDVLVEAFDDGVHTAIVDAIRTQDAQLQRMALTLPGTLAFEQGRRPADWSETWVETDVSALRREAEELRRQVQRLPKEPPPLAVREFLRAAKEGDARLSLLTTEVAAWIEAKGVAGRFRIGMRTEP